MGKMVMQVIEVQKYSCFDNYSFVRSELMSSASLAIEFHVGPCLRPNRHRAKKDDGDHKG